MPHSASSDDSEDDSYHDLPFDFHIRQDDLDDGGAVNDVSGSYDDGFHWEKEQSSDNTAASSPRKEEMSSSHLHHCDGSIHREIDLFSGVHNDQSSDLLSGYEITGDACSDFPVPMASTAAFKERQSTSSPLSTEQSNTFIPHKGSLRRIIHPPNQESSIRNQEQWPMYSITVHTEYPTAPHTSSPGQYQILYSRSQYEQYIKLFTLLDTECRSSLDSSSVKEFVWRYCPVVRRRDDALSTLDDIGSRELNELYSPTFDEIWKVVLQSDRNSPSHNTTARLGLEAWMVFARLLSLVSHLESQRRFASRHLQQMMRHKYNGTSLRNPNEVVVVIDNPPAGPPLPVSIRGLMEVESELGKEDERLSVEDWPYGSLSLMELDLDHAVKFDGGDGKRKYSNRKRRVVIEPFGTSSEGDFILRCIDNDNGDSREDTADINKSTVVRRSYADFYWLNETLVMQKRPGHGNLCGRILPPFPPRRASSSRGKTNPYHAPRSKDVSERAVAAAKSGVGMITSVAKSLWGNYIAPTASSLARSPASSPTDKVPTHYSWSGLSYDREEDASTRLAKRMDRYLNYLLENQALSTSFPLNAVLMVSAFTVMINDPRTYSLHH
jgi:hypothetical protein